VQNYPRKNKNLSEKGRGKKKILRKEKAINTSW